MNTKILTSIGCLLLLAAAIAPSALGHDDRASNAIFTNAAGVGVSGKYVGAAGPAQADSSNYGATIAGGSMLCDMEVVNFDLTDETLVDGSNLGPGTQGETFDDGGFGGACHTNYGVAGFSTYDTSGCSGTANAANGLPFGVFFGAACDWKTTIGGTPQSTILTTCVANALLPPPDAVAAAACVTAFIACTSNPVGCASGGYEMCGSDHVSDGINYGVGSALFPGTAHQGDDAYDYDSDGDAIMDATCAPSYATASVFVFEAVHTVGTTTTLHPAGSGEIWTT